MLAVTALSARAGVELAARSGIDCVALDLFGDVDTCRVATRWCAIGDAASLRIDGARFLGALRSLARDGRVQGWLAGSGFDEQPELLTQGAACLPLIGTAPDDVQRVREPRAFFALLDRLQLPHPPVCFDAPQAMEGWLVKDAFSGGGRGVRRACERDAMAAGRYWQRERPGLAMSVTFVGNGRDALLLGINRQLTHGDGERPFMFNGVIGPVRVSDSVARAVREAVLVLTRETQLRGLASLDFLMEGDAVELLEINPRLPASASLYAHAHPIELHRRACLHGELPAEVPPHSRVHGLQTVFARRALQLDERRAAILARWPQVHDVPRAGARFEAGQPLCSLSATGDDAPSVQDALAREAARILEALGA